MARIRTAADRTLLPDIPLVDVKEPAVPTKPEPPSTVIALVAEIFRDRRQTRHAAILLFSAAVAVVLVLAPVLAVMMLFSTTGAAAVGGVSVLATASVTVRRIAMTRCSRPGIDKPQYSSGNSRYLITIGHSET